MLVPVAEKTTLFFKVGKKLRGRVNRKPSRSSARQP
jgi:hypothetical protein